MLDAYIIEQLRKIERERARQERPRAPLPTPKPGEEEKDSETEKTPEVERGVLVIDLGLS